MSSLLFLAQSDTTLGFLSSDPLRINHAKARANQKILIEASSLRVLGRFSRIPSKYKNLIRRKSKTTFIYPNGHAIRVVRDAWHLRFLSSKEWLYSSSANKTKHDYDAEFAFLQADVVVCDARGLAPHAPSEIYKINAHSIKRIR